MGHTLSKIIFCGLAVLLLSSPFLISAKKVEKTIDDAKTNEEGAVRQVIQNYFDALKNIDADKAKLSIYDGAKIFSQQGDGFAEVSGKKIYESLKRSQKPYSPIPYVEKILQIELNDDIGMVKVERTLPRARLSGSKINPSDPAPGVVHITYLSLMKLKEGWKIVSVVTSIKEVESVSVKD